MEHLRLRRLFDFFLGQCAHRDKCNFSRTRLSIRRSSTSHRLPQKSPSEKLLRGSSLCIAYTGNPAPCKNSVEAVV
jgi:hypothetical protein